MSEYAFAGEVIKLTQVDLDKWFKKYPALDLVQELDQMDEEFSIRAREGAPVKKWFSEAYARLNGRNKIAEKNNARSTAFNGASSQRKLGHAEATRAQAQRALQRIDAQAGNSNLYADGGSLWIEGQQ